MYETAGSMPHESSHYVVYAEVVKWQTLCVTCITKPYNERY